jgi:CheY-like chemotaxis protein
MELRKAGFSLPILVLTGDSEVEAAKKAVESGANDYLVKDENLAETILTALEKVLQSK